MKYSWLSLKKERGQISTFDRTQLTGCFRHRPNVNCQVIRKWDVARPLRIASPGAFYHVTACGNERKAVFKSIRDRQKFLEYLIYSEFGKDPVTARSIKLYLCRKHSGEKLRTIGAQSCKRFNLKLEKDGKLKES
jgi:hypothetical protein